MSSTSFLSSIRWWREAARTAWLFAPRCLVPAMAFSLANVIMLVGSRAMYAAMRKASGGLGQEMSELVAALLIGSGCSLAGIAAMMWALGVLVVRLTAYAKVLIESPDHPARDDFEASLAAVATRKSYLAGFWAVGSLYLLVPAAPAIALLFIKALASQDYALALVGPGMPAWPGAMIDAGLVVLGGMIVSYSLVALSVSSTSQLPAAKAASHALRLSVTNWPGLLLITVVVCLLNSIVGMPQALCGSNSQNVSAGAFALVVSLQMAAGLVNSFVWPLSVQPFCELVRGKVR